MFARDLGREVAVCDFLRAREEVLDGPLDAALEDDVDRACQQQDDDERGNDIRRDGRMDRAAVISRRRDEHEVQARRSDWQCDDIGILAKRIRHEMRGLREAHDLVAELLPLRVGALRDFLLHVRIGIGRSRIEAGLRDEERIAVLADLEPLDVVLELFHADVDGYDADDLAIRADRCRARHHRRVRDGVVGRLIPEDVFRSLDRGLVPAELRVVVLLVAVVHGQVDPARIAF